MFVRWLKSSLLLIMFDYILYGNYTRMLGAILNKSRRQHPTRHQLYGHLPPITKTIQVRRTRHAGHCWRSKDELISDVLLWTPTYGQAKAGRPARTYIQQLCEDRGCSPEDLPGEVAREGQGYPCWRHDMMIMMIFHMYYIYIYIYIFMCGYTTSWCGDMLYYTVIYYGVLWNTSVMLEYVLCWITIIMYINYQMLILYYDGMCVRDMLDILCEDVFLTIMKTYQHILGVVGDGYKGLIEENGTNGASGLLWDYFWRGVGDF